MNFFFNKKLNFQYDDTGISLVVQWLRIHLAIQGWFQSLVRELDPTCCVESEHHNY